MSRYVEICFKSGAKVRVKTTGAPAGLLKSFVETLQKGQDASASASWLYEPEALINASEIVYALPVDALSLEGD